MPQDRGQDRHKNKWHTQVRDIPLDVWARIKAGASARYVNNGRGRTRPLNVGEYITRCVLLTEHVRNVAEEADSEAEFYKSVMDKMQELALEAVRA